MHNFKEFIDYVFSFYGEGGIYPENQRTREQIALATLHYLDDCDEDITWSKMRRFGIVVTFDERYEFVKLYDILRDMDFELTPLQESLFEKIEMGVDKYEI